jgi:pimeloyl-ACP methyl ester carboxylesterase
MQNPAFPKQNAVRSLLGGLQALSPSAAAEVAANIMFRTSRRRADGWEEELLARAKQLRVESRRGELAVQRWGDTGPLVLLVHGWNGRGSQLGAFVEPLLAEGFQVATFDAPGHGRSDGSRSSLIEFADAFDAVLDALRPFFQPLHGVVAHSMGGAAVTFALSRRSARGDRDREAGQAEPRLVFIAPPIDLNDFMHTVSTELGLSERTQAALTSLVERRIGERLDDLAALKLATRMQQPLLVLHDEQDRAVPVSCGQSLASAWPGAELHITRGLGHSRILRDPTVISRATRFLSRAS